MSLRTLSPTLASVVPTSATHSRPIVFELRPSGELPVIDCSCTVKKRLLGMNGRRRYNVALVRLRYVLIVSFVLGSFASWCLPFVKPQHGKWLAIVAVATQLLPVLNSFMSMRYDMLVLLFKTYEFWYISAINLVSCVLIAMRTGDIRAVFMSLLAMMFENVLLVDATSRSVTSVVLSSVFGAVVILGYALLEAFKVSTSSQNYLLVAYGSWLIDAVDVVIHGVSTIFAVLLRNGYRKWAAVRRIDQDSTVVRCVMYRARMMLAVVDDSNVIHPNSGVTHAASVRAVHLSDNSVSSTSALRLVPGGTLIRSDSFFIPAVPFVLGSKPTRFVWLSVGYTGYLLTAIAFFTSSEANYHSVIGTGAASSTTVFFVACIACQNRQLSRILLGGFDFHFLIVQIGSVRLVMCFLVRWSPYCLVILSSWVWTLWALSIGTYTPSLLDNLGIRRWFIKSVMLLVVIGQVWWAMELALRFRWCVNDRTLFTLTIASRQFRMQAIPLVFTRIWIITFWYLRLLWRFWTLRENERMLIQGELEYDDFEMQRRLRDAKNRAMIAQVRPTT